MLKVTKKEFGHLQFQVTSMRAMAVHAEIVSGAYKQRRTQCGDASWPGGWRPLTDEEKLAAAMATMKRHIDFMQSIIDDCEVDC